MQTCFSHIYKEKYDLQGLRAESVSLTWAPFLTIEGCNEAGVECEKNYGLLPSLCRYFDRYINFHLQWRIC